MNPRSDQFRHPADGTEDSKARARLVAQGFPCAPKGTLAIVAMVAFLGNVIGGAPVAADNQPEAAAEALTVTGDAGGADSGKASGILARFDVLLDSLSARIEDIRGQAEQMLSHADAASDSEGQMRFEEMYGKLVMAAEQLKEERDRLQSMRDELAAAGSGQQR